MRSETRKASTVIAGTSSERYILGDLADHRGHHDWKLSVDSVFNPVHERLQYAITDPAQFDPGAGMADVVRCGKYLQQSLMPQSDRVHVFYRRG